MEESKVDKMRVAKELQDAISNLILTVENKYSEAIKKRRDIMGNDDRTASSFSAELKYINLCADLNAIVDKYS